MKRKLSLLIGLLLFWPLSIGYASLAEREINIAAKKLDYHFFYWLFDDITLPQAYSLAQTEDFEPGLAVVFSKEMKTLMRINESRYLKVMHQNREFDELQAVLSQLSPEQKSEAISQWRSIFLDKIMVHMRTLKSLKPNYKLLLSSTTQYDSNVNRVPEEAEALGLPSDPSGKSDGQQLSLLSFTWKPLINNKNFSQNWKWDNSFNLIRITQFAHKENEVSIMSAEPKLTRKLNGNLDNISFAWKLQHFGLSGDTNSRSTHALFFSHALKAELALKEYMLKWGRFKKGKTSFSLTYIDKDQFTDANSGRDAKDIKLGVIQTFKYKAGTEYNSLGANLEYSAYSTDNAITNEYNYFQLKVNHSHSLNQNYTKNKIRLKEEFGYRFKTWDDYTGSNQGRNENFLYIQAQASTKLRKKLGLSLKLRQAYRNRDNDGSLNTKAHQTVIALGLNWSTP